MTYSDVITFLYNRLPAFERDGNTTSIKPGLANISRLMERLGNPHTTFKSIHIGGTNGKGSTSHMLAAVYQAAGYKVGLYTSPHLKSFTERIRLNGQPIPEADVVAFVDQHQAQIVEIGCSFFEVTVAMAFDYFARMQVDLAIIEVGLGGRLDSTNIITPVLSLITNIGLDHQEILGDTLEAIAEEKAGIIKPGVPVVISEYQESLINIWQLFTSKLSCKLYIANQLIKLTRTNQFNNCLIEQFEFDQQLDATNQFNYNVKLDLLGEYQRKNVAGVLIAIAVLTNIIPVRKEAIQHGLAHVSDLTGFKGRWQVLGHYPLIVADTAHNLPGIEVVMSMVYKQTYRQLHILLGVVADKNIEAVLLVLPKDAVYYFCSFQSSRAKPGSVLLEQAKPFGLIGTSFTEVNEAITSARLAAAPNDLILITGSTYLIAEVDEL